MVLGTSLRADLADFARRETVKTVDLRSGTPLTPLKRGVNEKGACERAPACTADFQSAVSRISNPQGLGIFQWFRVFQGPADWKSATQHLADFPRRLDCARFETVKTVELLSRTAITPLKRGVNEKGAGGRAPARAADFQSAACPPPGRRVSRVSKPAEFPVNPTAWDHPKPCRLEVGDTAGWKPAAHTLEVGDTRPS